MKQLELTIAIVDDEPYARDLIRLLLNDIFPEFRIVCDTGHVSHARMEIARHKPHILILDVEMPGGSGFELLDKLQDPPAIIFVTAHDQYAIRAVKASAHDYLLKPINKDEFREALEKVVCRLVQKDELKENPVSYSVKPEIRRIAIPSINGLNFLKVDDIVYCEADGNYTVIHFAHNREVVSRTLARFETDLNDFGFLRVHHKYLVNLNRISAYSKGKGGGYLVMTNRDVVQVSARKKGELFRLFTQVD